MRIKTLIIAHDVYVADLGETLKIIPRLRAFWPDPNNISHFYNDNIPQILILYK